MPVPNLSFSSVSDLAYAAAVALTNREIPSSPELLTWPDLTPLWWVLGGLGGGFLLLLLILLPFAVFGTGAVGDNARNLFRLILGTFHTAIEVFAHRRGCSERHHPQGGDDPPPDAGSTGAPDPGGQT